MARNEHHTDGVVLDSEQSTVLDWLSRQLVENEPEGRVERIVTHAAVVLLAGDRAYKIKRAVRYPYLDYSTLAHRKNAVSGTQTLARPISA